MTLRTYVLSFTFPVILLWHCPITSGTVIFKCCQILTGWPRTSEKDRGEADGNFRPVVYMAISQPAPRMGRFLITCSGKVMTQGLVHLLWSCCPSPPHPAPFIGKCRVSGTDRILEVLAVASTSCALVGKCSHPQENEDPEVSGWNEQLFSLYSLRGVNDCCKACGVPRT